MAKKLSLFWFRRDLRWHDNHALFKALTHFEEVIPIFIFDTSILDKLNKNDRRVSLLFDRIHNLNAEIWPKKINIQYGSPEHIFKKILRTHDVEAVFCNEDY